MPKKKDAIKFYQNENNKYKVELIEELEDGTITFCDHSNFSDLCKGGHIPNTGFIRAVKLLSIAGAYWRGNENNKQLTRVYGISFPKQKDLSEYLNLLEEAKKRDHRKLGKELDLFTFSQKVGQGLPLWLPKGTALRERLENFLKKAQKKAGYEQVISPHIGNKDLYNDNIVFQFYSKSADKKPGKNKPSEKMEPGREKDFIELSEIKDWRKVLSNFYVGKFELDGYEWNSVGGSPTYEYQKLNVQAYTTQAGSWDTYNIQAEIPETWNPLVKWYFYFRGHDSFSGDGLVNGTVWVDNVFADFTLVQQQITTPIYRDFTAKITNVVDSSTIRVNRNYVQAAETLIQEKYKHTIKKKSREKKPNIEKKKNLRKRAFKSQ